ncbi:MAG: urease accessory protein UreE [Myxococcota bacterium]|nr:urease accessory protein UreE [Myxococcota bacterium]
MIKLTHRYTGARRASDSLSMTYQERTKGRIRVTSTDGGDFGLFLERGHPLKDGEHLASDDGVIVRVDAQPEALIEADCDDWSTFAKCCYHLGNRHVPIEIHDRKLFIERDPVLANMLRHLGMRTHSIQRAFHPEQGAYGHAH